MTVLRPGLALAGRNQILGADPEGTGDRPGPQLDAAWLAVAKELSTSHFDLPLLFGVRFSGAMVACRTSAGQAVAVLCVAFRWTHPVARRSPVGASCVARARPVKSKLGRYGRERGSARRQRSAGDPPAAARSHEAGLRGNGRIRRSHRTTARGACRTGRHPAQVGPPRH